MPHPLDKPLTDVARIKKSRCGVVIARDGRIDAIRFRLWPKLASRVGAWLSQYVGWPRWGAPDTCRLYYHSAGDYIAISYMERTRRTRLSTVLAALRAVEQVGEIRDASGWVAEITNIRISSRILARFGWSSIPSPGRWQLYRKTRATDRDARHAADLLRFAQQLEDEARLAAEQDDQQHAELEPVGASETSDAASDYSNSSG